MLGLERVEQTFSVLIRRPLPDELVDNVPSPLVVCRKKKFNRDVLGIFSNIAKINVNFLFRRNLRVHIYM